MKKLLCLVLILVTVFIPQVPSFADDTTLSIDLTVPTDSAYMDLPRAKANVAYGPYPLTVTNGSGNYKFEIAQGGTFPDGIYLSEAGAIYGTPTRGGYTYSNMKVKVTDLDTQATAERTLRLFIEATAVYFYITKNVFYYDNQPHTVEWTAKDKDGNPLESFINETNVTITYGDDVTESQKNVGEYELTIVVDAPGYYYYSMDRSNMVIRRNETTSATFTGDAFTYDGDPQGPEVSVTATLTEEEGPISLREDCTLTYESTDGYGYNKSTAPHEAGSYRVTCTLTEEAAKNFVQPNPNSANFVISPQTVNFTIENISQRCTGEPLYPTITNDSGWTVDEDYTVTYIDKNGNQATPKDVGTYTIVITPKDTRNYAVSQTATEFMITADLTAYTFVEYGNSIAAQILGNGGNVETEFIKNGDKGHTYKEVYYCSSAWMEGANLDEDETALFVYNRETVDLPEVTAVGGDGATPAEVITTLVTADAEIDLTGRDKIDLTGETTYTDSAGQGTYSLKDLSCGVYTIRYSVAGSANTAERKLVVLWQLGDANQDTNVNSIDGNYIKYHNPLAEETANEKLFKYRICNVDKDEDVDVTDAEWIYSRFNPETPITEYYK